MKTRSAGIIIKDGAILLLERVNSNRHYFSFPGGTLEEGETPEQTAKREVLEETSVEVVVQELLYKVSFKSGKEEYFFLADYVSGEPKLAPDAPELVQIKEGQVYKPQWVSLEQLEAINLLPQEIKQALLHDLKNSFAKRKIEVQHFSLYFF